MGAGPSEPPPLPRPPLLAAIVGPCEDLPPIHPDLTVRFARETISASTRRALERDLRHLVAWRRVAARRDLAFLETEDALARFTRDHSVDLEAFAHGELPKLTADVLRNPRCWSSYIIPGPGPLERRLESWRRLHGACDFAETFGGPALRLWRERARVAGCADHQHTGKKSASSLDSEILYRLVAARAGLHGQRKAALAEATRATSGRGVPRYRLPTSTGPLSQWEGPSSYGCARRGRERRQRRGCCCRRTGRHARSARGSGRQVRCVARRSTR